MTKNVLFLSIIINLIFIVPQTFGIDFKHAIGYDVRNEALTYRMVNPDYYLDVLAGIQIESRAEFEDNSLFEFRIGCNYVQFDSISNAFIINKFGGIFIGREDSHWEGGDKLILGISAGISPEIFIKRRFSIEIPFGILMEIDTNRTILRTFGSDLFITGGFKLHFYLDNFFRF